MGWAVVIASTLLGIGMLFLVPWFAVGCFVLAAIALVAVLIAAWIGDGRGWLVDGRSRQSAIRGRQHRLARRRVSYR
jgi:hypothetical protein